MNIYIYQRMREGVVTEKGKEEKEEEEEDFATLSLSLTTQFLQR